MSKIHKKLFPNPKASLIKINKLQFTSIGIFE